MPFILKTFQVSCYQILFDKTDAIQNESGKITGWHRTQQHNSLSGMEMKHVIENRDERSEIAK
jgi:hypothetical protein